MPTPPRASPQFPGIPAVRPLAAGVGLPRFIDKARQHFADTWPSTDRRAFGHARATDAAFLAHLPLSLAAARAAVAEHPSDETVTRWFLGQPGVNSATLADGNTRAPHLGQPGQPGEQALRFALKTISALCAAPRITRAFTAIAWDEGYRDDLVPPALGSAGDYSATSRFAVTIQPSAARWRARRQRARQRAADAVPLQFFKCSRAPASG